MSRLLYSLAIHLMIPWALVHLAWRARRQSEYLRHVGERLGFFPPAGNRPLLWLHAVSVGETRAAEPLIRLLQSRHPDQRILLTHGTPTGRQAGAELFGSEVTQAYLPYDFPWAVRRFLRHYRPVAALFLETELWPNLVRACRRQGVPAYLVNARMSEKSARGYRFLSPLTRATLRDLSAIGSQTEGDAQRLRQLGAEKVAVTGNLKFDRTVPPEMLERGQRLRAALGGSRPIFLAASTRDGEETLILDGLARHPVPRLLTIIVPRHPQRFDTVADLLAKRGLRFQRRSQMPETDVDCTVLLGDTMGEMFAYYAASDLAFVGGSLLPLGGQNLLEACAVGTPVIVGPHTFNFADITRQAERAGAALRVAGPEELGGAVAMLIADPQKRAAMAAAGKRFTDAHRGATLRTLQILDL